MEIRILLLMFVLFLFPGTVTAKGGGKALMLTAFGTSTVAAVTFDELVPLVQLRFPDRDIVVPFTSGIIRNKLNAEISDPAEKILSPAEMLEKLKAEGYKDIAVVSTILFAGIEHEKLQSTVGQFSAANKSLKISYVPPLLASPANFKPVVALLGKYMLRNGSNVVVAHGTHGGHPVEKDYMKLAEMVADTYPNARVGSVEGVPEMEEVMEWVKDGKENGVRFVVFMFVAGDHAENDIASDEDGSMFSTVRGMGKTPSVQMVDTRIGKRMASLGLDPDYRNLLLDHYARNVIR